MYNLADTPEQVCHDKFTALINCTRSECHYDDCKSECVKTLCDSLPADSYPTCDNIRELCQNATHSSSVISSSTANSSSTVVPSNMTMTPSPARMPPPTSCNGYKTQESACSPKCDLDHQDNLLY